MYSLDTLKNFLGAGMGWGPLAAKDGTHINLGGYPPSPNLARPTVRPTPGPPDCALPHINTLPSE